MKIKSHTDLSIYIWVKSHIDLSQSSIVSISYVRIKEPIDQSHAWVKRHIDQSHAGIKNNIDQPHARVKSHATPSHAKESQISHSENEWFGKFSVLAGAAQFSFTLVCSGKK